MTDYLRFADFQTNHIDCHGNVYPRPKPRCVGLSAGEIPVRDKWKGSVVIMGCIPLSLVLRIHRFLSIHLSLFIYLSASLSLSIHLSLYLSLSIYLSLSNALSLCPSSINRTRTPDFMLWGHSLDKQGLPATASAPPFCYRLLILKTPTFASSITSGAAAPRNPNE